MKFYSLDELENDFKKTNRKARKQLSVDFAYQLSRTLVRARLMKGLTQDELAALMKTSQSAIARSESGNRAPSVEFLMRLAKVYKTELLPPKLAFLEKKTEISLNAHQSGNATVEARNDAVGDWLANFDTVANKETVTNNVQ